MLPCPSLGLASHLVVRAINLSGADGIVGSCKVIVAENSLREQGLVACNNAEATGRPRLMPRIAAPNVLRFIDVAP